MSIHPDIKPAMSSTVDFLRKIEAQIIIFVTLGDKLQDKIATMLGIKFKPSPEENLTILIDKDVRYSADYGTGFISITSKRAAEIIDFLNEERRKDPCQVKILLDPFNLLLSTDNIRWL